ncbi:endonuclease/exonuclease/phosphatase family protein [bacterium]|nr:endonuclease/exonuclease/phosphatase family protein [bacterium]
MKIASYNIWNSSTNAKRFNQIAEEINEINADIIGLQEVPDRNYHDQLLKLCEYKYATFFSHSGEEEGLSVFSKHPIIESKYLECSLIAFVKYNDVVINITNLHLDWKSALKREKEIIALNNATKKSKSDYAFMLGDFNCSVNSSVHQYLLGQSSLLGEEANPYWYDLAESYAGTTQTSPEITLDFKNNPRWVGVNTIEINQRFDRILLQNTYPKTYPVLKNFTVFGKEISLQTGMAPSDHYGVCVELNFD